MKKLSFIIVFVFLSILFVQAQQAKYVFYFIFKEILEGKHDDVPESYFLNVGSIDEVRAKMQ